MNHWEKKVKQLVTKPEGRAALKKFGIDVQLVKDEKELAELPIVAVLCPTYRAPEPQMRDALTEMVRYTREKNVATIYSGPPLQTSVVHWSRNGLISEQLRSGKPWTHVLFIDDDIVVEPDALERLLSHKKDIIAGLCTRRSDPPIPNIRGLNPDTGALSDQIWEWKEGACIEVDGVGTGLMLISRHALEQVAQAYFDCLFEKEAYQIPERRLAEMKKARMGAFDEAKICYWFRFLPSHLTQIEMGEDMSFCYIAKKYCDLGIFVDTSVMPGHLGNYPYSIRDFMPHRDEMILKAKVNGNYPMDVPDMKISILCPTRGRPENVKRLIESLRETATVMPEVVLYVDEDDIAPDVDAVIVRGERITLSKCWNRCAEAATGEILMQCGDDVVFRTKGWDDEVRRAFAAFEDRLIFVHGDDGVYQHRFGTHGFVHRKWIEAVGYFSPPYFSSDFGDTWLNEVANRINRRIYLPFLTEHLHPLTGKAEWDKTHKERIERGKQDNVEKLYAELAPERMSDVQKLLDAINGKSLPARQPLVGALQPA